MTSVKLGTVAEKSSFLRSTSRQMPSTEACEHLSGQPPRLSVSTHERLEHTYERWLRDIHQRS